MPVVPANDEERRDKLARPAPMSREEITDLMVLVARPVGKKELTQNAKAQAAVDMNKKALEMESVRECPRRRNKRIGRFMLARSSRSALKKEVSFHIGDPLRKFTGRTACL